MSTQAARSTGPTEHYFDTLWTSHSSRLLEIVITPQEEPTSITHRKRKPSPQRRLAHQMANCIVAQHARYESHCASGLQYCVAGRGIAVCCDEEAGCDEGECYLDEEENSDVDKIAVLSAIGNLEGEEQQLGREWDAIGRQMPGL